MIFVYRFLYEFENVCKTTEERTKTNCSCKLYNSVCVLLLVHLRTAF